MDQDIYFVGQYQSAFVSIVCQVKYCSEGVCTEPSEKNDVQGKHIPKNLRTQLVQINKKD